MSTNVIEFVGLIVSILVCMVSLVFVRTKVVKSQTRTATKLL